MSDEKDVFRMTKELGLMSKGYRVDFLPKCWLTMAVNGLD
jgi:hypothetical protein